MNLQYPNVFGFIVCFTFAACHVIKSKALLVFDALEGKISPVFARLFQCFDKHYIALESIHAEMRVQYI